MSVDSSVRAAMTALVLSLVATFSVGRSAYAQLAPTGSHYATRSSDTGHDLVGPNQNGDYRASIPLNLPPARGGLPIPLEVASGTRGFGAAGLGWDIPLSYVLIDHSFAHRRPAYQPLAPATPRERVIVALPGRSADMIAQDSTHWISRNSFDLSMTFDATTGSYIVYDGSGLSYRFVMKPELANTSSNLWLLDEIDGPGHSSVKLYYTIATGAVVGAAGPTISIDLSEIDYNTHPTGTCFKNQVVLGYEALPSTAPALSTSIVGDAVLVRRHKVDVIDLDARSTCGATPVRLLRYSLKYLIDPDTGLNRLSSVSVSGREDRPEGTSNILLGVYTYGAATSIDNTGAKSLQYLPDAAVSVAAPTATPPATGSTVQVASSLYQPPTSGPIYASQQGLTDFTGDGRPDVVFATNGQLQIARSQGQAGTAGTYLPPVPFTDATMTRQVLDARTSTAKRFAQVPVYTANEEYIWRQAIDVNGDGRIDFIDAGESPNKWIVYLNTPDSGPSGIKWVRRAVDVTQWQQDFRTRGLPVPANYLPLSHRISGREHHYYQCFRWDSATAQYLEDPADRGGAYCPIDPNAPLTPDGVERTYVDWELADANGDGYPDFVFNLTAFQMVGNKPPTHTTQYVVFQQDIDLKHAGSADVYLALNVAGVALYNDNDQRDPFARGSLLIQNSACGVEEWSGFVASGKEIQKLACGLLDVNGDGLLDRVEDTTAYLGTGSGFKTMPITLPAYAALHQSGYADKCPSGGTSFETAQLNGLRDLNGDGIPDLVFRDPNNLLTGAPFVALGTGAGFTTPLAWDGGPLSHEWERCDGSMSYTDAGLFDITGDGKADLVTIDGSGSSATLHVSELNGQGVRGGPQVGRLTSVNNGAGAVTNISYRSAKDDSTTQHQVPFPEIVVDQVGTQGTYNLGGTLATTTYAYGNISLFYDSALDVFRSTGYARRVSLVRTATSPVSAPFSAEIVDRYPFDGNTTLTDDGRYLRYQKVGQVSDVNVLAVGADDNAWGLLTDNVSSDTRRIKGTHADLTGHMVREANSAATQDCIEVINPYDFEASFAYNVGSSYNPCSVHGYSYVSDSTAWRGTAAPPSAANVQTHQSVLSVDSYGRPTSIFQDGDAHRTDDDVCVDVSYAAPALSGLHVPWVPASKRVWGCSKNNLTYAEEYFEYDGMSSGLVSQGLLTSHTVHRHRTDNGQDFRTIREFDISYDAAANPLSVTTTREDSAKRTSTVTFDEFGLAPVRIDVQGSGLPDLAVTNSIDPISEQVLASTDATGTTHGETFDGFGRGIYETIQPQGGAAGVMTATTYIGFETPGAVRQVQMKTFVDPVPATDVGISEGRVATTYLDELARPQRTELQLGDDYAKQIMIIGSRAYDPLGRVLWEADPYPSTQDGKTAYGTMQYFNQDGTLDVAIRGSGPQLYSLTPDASVERFPTLYSHSFANNQETTQTQTADALTATSPQFGVSRQALSTATGRVLSRSTWQASTRLEYAELAYDQLGQLAAMTRYQNAAAPSIPVTTTWQLDDAGHVLGLTEPTPSLQQTRTYSDWGELKQIHWDAQTNPPSGSDIFYSYDALGRVTHSEEQTSGVVDPDTIFNYGYDTPRTSPIADNVYTLGRLSYATSPRSETRFGYDAFGNVNASTFIDATDGSTYVQQDSYHANGSKAFIELALPDASYVPERMDYEYDTAGRLRWMWFNDGTNTQELYSATDVDVWGRLRAATLGPNSFYAGYADTGRRLPKSAGVKAGTQSRSFAFNSFDPVGRELSKTMSSPRFSGIEAYTYGAQGTLATLTRTQGSATSSSWNFAYDPLGNTKQLIDNVGTKDAAMTYTSADHDRICSIAYGGFNAGPICNFHYDNFGNVTVEPNRSGSTSLSYFISGGVRSMTNTAGYQAAFHYGAFGQRESLDITLAPTTSRSEHTYGGLISKRAQKSTAGSTSYISRTFPGDSFVLSRRGPKGPWVTQYSDSNGTRFTADDAGTFAQDVDYGPFGEATSTGAQLGMPEYTSDQWNDGDLLDGFGLVQVGARIYDPVIGRFLSRDPLMIPRTATTTNPYAFAFNDPVNFADRSGMDPCGSDPLCISNSGDSGSSNLGSVVGVAGWVWNQAFGDSGQTQQQHQPAPTMLPLSSLLWMPIASQWQAFADATNDPNLKRFFQSGANEMYRNVVAESELMAEPPAKQWVRFALSIPIYGHIFKAGAYMRTGYGTAAAQEAGLAGLDAALEVAASYLPRIRLRIGALFGEEAPAFSRLVRGGGLAAHEAAGGHVLLKHIGKTESELLARLAAEPHIPAASTFTSRAEAEAAVSSVLESHADEIAAWQRVGTPKTLPLTGPFEGGIVVPRGATAGVPGANVLVILKRDMQGGWFILTGFPTP